MNDPSAATTKRMKLRYAGVCRGCGVEISAGVSAVYDKVAKNVTCLGCSDETPVAPLPVIAGAPLVPEPVLAEEPEVVVGVAGASARREYERRKTNDERHIAEWKGRVRSKHPVLGELMLAVADEPKNSGTRAWDIGAHGEEVFAASLDRLAGEGLYFLHDRRIPPTRANIDHIVIAPTGVYVIDAKNYTGRAQLSIKGGTPPDARRTSPDFSSPSTSKPWMSNWAGKQECYWAEPGRRTLSTPASWPCL